LAFLLVSGLATGEQKCTPVSAPDHDDASGIRRRSMPRRTDDGVIRIVDDDVIRVIDDDDVEVPDGHTVKVRMNMMDDMMVVRRPTFDAAAHQPGFRTDNDAYLRAYREFCADAGHSSDRVSVHDARAERSRWIADMQDAWRMDARRVRKPAPDDDDPDENNDEPEGSSGQYNRQYRSRRELGLSAMPFKVDARAAYDAMCSRLRDAWRMPACDFAEPDTGSSAEELARHRRGDPSGVTDPDRAGSIEERVERTRGRIWNDYKTRLENAWRDPPGVHPAQPAQVAVGPASFIAGVASPDPAVRTRRVSSGPGPARSGR
jgi:hypothetical protein